MKINVFLSWILSCIVNLLREIILANLKKSLEYCDKARDSYLLFFPEIQLSPFFPQYEKQNVDRYCLKIESDELVLVYQ